MKSVSGEDAALYDAIRLDSYHTINSGKLLSADETTGAVSWTDMTGETKSVTLGERMVWIKPRAKR